MSTSKKEILNKDSGFKTPNNYLDEFENSFKHNSDKLKNSFKTPDNYFKTVEDKIIDKLEYERNMTTGFKVPLDYFDTFESKATLKRAEKTKLISLFNKTTIKTIGLSIAASILLFIGINNYNSNNQNLEIHNLSLTELDTWMEEDLITFNTYEIADTFTENELNLVDIENDELSDYFDLIDVEDLILEN